MTSYCLNLTPSIFRKAKMSSSTNNEVNPQTESPLFNRIPGEIRNQIFALVFPAYYDKANPFPQDDYYYRPGFRYAHRIDTALLCTCRRAYLETHTLPCSLNSHVEWHNRGPPIWTAKQASHRSMTSVQLFIQQVNLESWDQWIAQRLTQEYDHLRELRITIRHSDWWSWEHWATLGLDPKYSGRVAWNEYSAASAPFEEGAWGRSFERFVGLERFVLELETREGKKSELDAIVARAGDWGFLLGDGKSLVLDPAKTRKTGWIGFKLRRCFLALRRPNSKPKQVTDDLKLIGSFSPEQVAGNTYQLIP